MVRNPTKRDFSSHGSIVVFLVLTWERSIWAHSPIANGGFMDEYHRNSMERDSSEMRRICAAVKEAGVFVVLGYSERYRGTLYIAQVRTHARPPLSPPSPAFPRIGQS